MDSEGGTYIPSLSIPGMRLLIATPLCVTLHLLGNFFGGDSTGVDGDIRTFLCLPGRTPTLCPWGHAHVFKECVPLPLKGCKLWRCCVGGYVCCVTACVGREYETSPGAAA